MYGIRTKGLLEGDQKGFLAQAVSARVVSGTNFGKRLEDPNSVGGTGRR